MLEEVVLHIYTIRMNRHNDDWLGGSSCLQCPTVYDHTDDIFL